MIVQTEGDLVGLQRGSVTSVTQSILLGMWNGWEIIFHLYCEDIQSMSYKLSMHTPLQMVQNDRKEKNKKFLLCLCSDAEINI